MVEPTPTSMCGREANFLWFFFLAYLHSILATVCKRTSWYIKQQIWWGSPKRIKLFLALGVKFWNTHKQSPGIRMFGIFKYFMDCTCFHYFTSIHYLYPISKVSNNSQVVSYQYD